MNTFPLTDQMVEAVLRLSSDGLDMLAISATLGLSVLEVEMILIRSVVSLFSESNYGDE